MRGYRRSLRAWLMLLGLALFLASIVWLSYPSCGPIEDGRIFAVRAGVIKQCVCNKRQYDAGWSCELRDR